MKPLLYITTVLVCAAGLLTRSASAFQDGNSKETRLIVLPKKFPAAGTLQVLLQRKDSEVSVSRVGDILVLVGTKDKVDAAKAYGDKMLADLKGQGAVDPAYQVVVYSLEHLTPSDAQTLLTGALPFLGVTILQDPRVPALTDTPKAVRDTNTTTLTNSGFGNFGTGSDIFRNLENLQNSVNTIQNQIDFATPQTSPTNGGTRVPGIATLHDKLSRRAFAGPATLLLVGTEDELDAAVKILEGADSAPPQVVIEARVVEVSPESIRSLGIEWGNEEGILASTEIKETDPTGILRFGRFTRSGVQIDATLRALEERGAARTLASPVITAVNEKQAEIFIGDQYKYATFVNTDTQGRVNTELANTDVGITLRVKPLIHLTSKEVTIALNPTVSNIIGFSKNIDGNLLIPLLRTRRADTSVRLADGEMLAIGGLISDEEVRRIQKIPFLAELPVIGQLFRSRERRRRRTEVFILLSPRIVDPTNPAHKRKLGDKPLFHEEEPELPTRTPSLPPDRPLDDRSRLAEGAWIFLDSDTVKPGKTLSGRVELRGPAPTGGLEFTLEFDRKDVADRKRVKIPAGKREASFEVQVKPTAPTGPVTITARHGEIGDEAKFKVESK